jgi:hypothetical protein
MAHTSRGCPISIARENLGRGNLGSHRKIGQKAAGGHRSDSGRGQLTTSGDGTNQNIETGQSPNHDDGSCFHN